MDMATEEITHVHGLGFKDWSKSEMDASDRDGGRLIQILTFHVNINYENLPMQTEIVFQLKNCKFHQKNFDIFLIFAQNIDCGYTLEPPRRVLLYKSGVQGGIHCMDMFS